jgi:hypothetical protein
MVTKNPKFKLMRSLRTLLLYVGCRASCRAGILPAHWCGRDAGATKPYCPRIACTT